VRCGQCAGCAASNCGKCNFCRDMPKFGGTGTLRQPCLMRRCEELLKAQREEAMERAAKRAEEREANAEERQKEREARQAEREANQLARREAGLLAKGKSDAARLVLSGPKHRAPTVELEELTGGWGEIENVAGLPVEVMIDEEDLSGAYYTGQLVVEPRQRSPRGASKASQTPEEVMVRYDDLLADEDSEEKLVESNAISSVRPKPPETPVGFHRLIETGDTVELRYEDGWWEVQVDEVLRADPATFRVSSVLYAKSHSVGPSVLRPKWQWAPQARTWRYELDVGHGCVVPASGAGKSEATFKFVRGVPRSHNDVGNRKGMVAPLLFAAATT